MKATEERDGIRRCAIVVGIAKMQVATIKREQDTVTVVGRVWGRQVKLASAHLMHNGNSQEQFESAVIRLTALVD